MGGALFTAAHDHHQNGLFHVVGKTIPATFALKHRQPVIAKVWHALHFKCLPGIEQKIDMKKR